MQQRFLLQILLLAQHVSGTTMPIIRSSRVYLLYSGCCLWYFVLWFSSCWSGVELRVMCPVCRMLQHPANRLLVDVLRHPPTTFPLQSVLTQGVYRQATRNSHREWQYHMLHVYNCILMKMSTWGSKHVEENSILWINNNQCIKLVINIESKISKIIFKKVVLDVACWDLHDKLIIRGFKKIAVQSL